MEFDRKNVYVGHRYVPLVKGEPSITLDQRNIFTVIEI